MYCIIYYTDETALPWPVRLLEWNDDVLVELLIAGCVDGELNYFSYWHQTNQSASLRWQRCSEYCKLDLRLAIRKELKKVKTIHTHTHTHS